MPGLTQQPVSSASATDGADVSAATCRTSGPTTAGRTPRARAIPFGDAPAARSRRTSSNRSQSVTRVLDRSRRTTRESCSGETGPGVGRPSGRIGRSGDFGPGSHGASCAAERGSSTTAPPKVSVLTDSFEPSYPSHMDRQQEFDVFFEPQEEGGYTAYVPDLPGCISEGETLEEAVEMIGEAMALYLESRQEHGWPLPRVEHRKVAPAA